MNANIMYKLGTTIVLVMIIMSVSGIYYSLDFPDGLAPAGKVAMWLIPLVLAVVLLLAVFLKNKQRYGLANVLLWIPATPFVIGLAITLFLAAAFILFGK